MFLESERVFRLKMKQIEIPESATSMYVRECHAGRQGCKSH